MSPTRDKKPWRLSTGSARSAVRSSPGRLAAWLAGLIGFLASGFVPSAHAGPGVAVGTPDPNVPMEGVGFLARIHLASANPIASIVTNDKLEFRPSAGKVEIATVGKPIAAYVYQDDQILRPYFTHLKLPSGIEITRSHPPVEGIDSTDHATMHPGLWLGFGDISGADFWRNKARVEQIEFVEEPTTNKSIRSFAVRNRFQAGERIICEQSCRYTFHSITNGCLIVVDTTFRPAGEEFSFGAQEEMGLGVRVATPIAVKNGGVMIDSEGRKNEKQIWGNVARWLDYHGVIRGEKIGAQLMPHPENPRPCWFHARDYGLAVANPFERPDKAKGASSRVSVKRGQTFRLRFGVYLHEGNFDPNEAYEIYLKSRE